MGTLLRTNNRPTVALKYFDKAIRLMPDHVRANYGKAMVLYQLKKTNESILQFEKTLRLDPDFKPAQDALEQIQTIKKSGK